MKKTTQLFSDSLVRRMLKTEHPLLVALAGRQRARRTKDQPRAFTLKKNGTMTFLPKGKDPEFNEDGTRWTAKNRQAARIGRALRELVALTGIGPYTDSDYEQAIYCLQAQAVAMKPDTHNFVFAQGYEEVKNWYLQPESDVSSCMRTDYPSRDFGFYGACKNVRILVLTNEKNVMIARAMVWNTYDDKIFMDRVYYRNEKHHALMKDYARTNGWYYYDNGYIRTPEDQYKRPFPFSEAPQMIVLIDFASYTGRQTYLDTFQYFYPSICVSNRYVDPKLQAKLKKAKTKEQAIPEAELTAIE